MSKIIVVSNVTFSYETSEDAPLVLDGVSIDIESGSFVAMLGHNGSGKSTLARLLNGIMIPLSGDVIVDGMNTRDEKFCYDIRQKVGMVFQNPDNQIVATMVEEDVAFAPENLGIEPAEIRRRVDEALESVKMTEYREHAPHLLSGGQKQRVAIAGIIAMHPKCLVLDEPTAMLDPVGRREVISTVRRLNKEYGITVVLITHHMNEAALADRILVLNRGKVLLDGTPSEVFSKVEEMKSVGLSVPTPVELLFELKKDGYDVDIGAVTAEDCAKVLIKLLENVNADNRN